MKDRLQCIELTTDWRPVLKLADSDPIVSIKAASLHKKSTLAAAWLTHDGMHQAPALWSSLGGGFRFAGSASLASRNEQDS